MFVAMRAEKGMAFPVTAKRGEPFLAVEKVCCLASSRVRKERSTAVSSADLTLLPPPWLLSGEVERASGGGVCEVGRNASWTIAW